MEKWEKDITIQKLKTMWNISEVSVNDDIDVEDALSDEQESNTNYPLPNPNFTFPDTIEHNKLREIETGSPENPLILQEVTSTIADVNEVTSTDPATSIFTISTPLPSQPISFPQ